MDYIPFNKQTFDLFCAEGGYTKLRFNHNLNDNSIVFDLGGYDGEWSLKMSEKYKCNFYIFEPIKSFYDTIINKFLNNSKVKSFNFGLGNKDESLEISVNGDGSSFFETNNKKETVYMIDFIKFLNEHNIENVDLLKINIEGSEYDVLEYLLKNEKINIFNSIYVQFHRFIPGCVERRKNIIEKLKETHNLVFCYDFIWEKWEKKI